MSPHPQAVHIDVATITPEQVDAVRRLIARQPATDQPRLLEQLGLADYERWVHTGTSRGVAGRKRALAGRRTI